MQITVPASGKGDADTWLVMKTAGGKVRFKSQTTGTELNIGVSVRTSHPLGLFQHFSTENAFRFTQSFMKNFGFHEYPTLKVKVVDVQGDKFCVKPTTPKFSEDDPAFLQLKLSAEGSEWQRLGTPPKQQSLRSKKAAETSEDSGALEAAVAKSGDESAFAAQDEGAVQGCDVQVNYDTLLYAVQGGDTFIVQT